MDEPRKLLDEFALPTADQWRREVDSLLKGASFERKMLTKTREGITVQALYSAADTRDISWLDSLPGQAPFVRGATAAGHLGQPWLVAQELEFDSAQSLRETMVEALAKGQTAVTIAINYNCDILTNFNDWKTAFEGVDLAQISVQIFAGSKALPVAAMMSCVMEDQGAAWGAFAGCVGGDPHAVLARRGTLPSSLESSFCQLATLTEQAMTRAPKLRTILVEEAPWHEGGADLALSLGLTLSSAVAMLREFDARGLRPTSTAPHFQFNMEMGTDFFMEMAKLRALRLLWSRILTASGVSPEKSATFVHASTARRDHTRLAPYVNMLRVTTEAMSAIMGGANSLSVRPFGVTHDGMGRLGSRVARNVQLILAQECRLGQVTDPAGGAWYVESLTRDLAEAAWREFQEIEAGGGIAAGLESQAVQTSINEVAEARAAAIATRREVIVGVNKYPDPSGMSEVDEAVAEGSEKRYVAADLAGKTFADVAAALAAGEELGAVDEALKDDGQENEVVDVVPLRRASLPFEKLWATQHQLRAKNEALARVLIVCLGDVAGYGPRLDFVREFFAIGGYEVTCDGFHTTAQSGVELIAADGALTVILVGLDHQYLDLAPELITGLKQTSNSPQLIIAGAPENREQLVTLGVETFITAESDVVAELGKISRQMEARS